MDDGRLAGGVIGAISSPVLVAVNWAIHHATGWGAGSSTFTAYFVAMPMAGAITGLILACAVALLRGEVPSFANALLDLLLGVTLAIVVLVPMQQLDWGVILKLLVAIPYGFLVGYLCRLGGPTLDM